MNPYIHRVHYYETDKMGITHHSNYIRWMEEARIDFLEQIGWSYAKLEQLGVVSPVVGVECRYKSATTFSDDIAIEVAVAEFRGVKIMFSYEMRNQDDAVVCVASSTHCFLNGEGKPVNLKRQLPELADALAALVE